MYLNLAASDLLNCLFPSTVTALGLFNKRDVSYMSQETLDMFGWMLSTLPIVSLYIICCIYTARMWAIYRSLSYRVMFTKGRVAVVVTVFWLMSAGYAAIPFMCSSHYLYIKEVSIITFSVSKDYLKVDKIVEEAITVVTVAVIDLPLLIVCFCSAVSIWFLQKSTAFPLRGNKNFVI